MTNLPIEFTRRMSRMLGEDVKDFIASYEKNRNNGLRINRLRTCPHVFMDKAPFNVEPIPWVDGGFFYSYEQRASAHPFYNAGVYYLQEPSAMTPADRFPVEKGDRVLDLCAAPGGKATALAGKLSGTGLLVANEISTARSKALLHNLEVSGASNIVVLNESPEKLEKNFPLFFDKILVDAPCSGEGMFRKSEDALNMWSMDRVEELAALQKNILKCAYNMLRPGGLLMYSTCTFSPEENEKNIAWLLAEYPDLRMQDIKPYEGFDHGHPEWADGSEEIKKAVRIWPHKMNGEGHFLALLKKEGSENYAGADRRDNPVKNACVGAERRTRPQKKNKSKGSLAKEEKRLVEDFLSGCVNAPDADLMENRGGMVFLPALPEEMLSGLKTVRNGLFVGELKKDRFEPSQAFAMTLSASAYRYSIDLTPDDPDVMRYLKGETLSVREPEKLPKKAWILICTAGFPLGFARLSGGLLKNKLLYHWRS